MKGPCAASEQFVDLRRGEASPPHLQQDRHHAAHHPSQEGVRRHANLDEAPAPGHRHLDEVPHRAAPPVAPERREVAVPRKARRRGLHGRHVEPVVDLERPMSVQRRSRATVPNAIAVHAQRRVAARVEARRRGTQAAHRHVRGKCGVQPPSQLRPGKPPLPASPRKAEGDHLSGGMHPGIGSSGETDSHPLTGQSVKGLLQHSRDGPAGWLDLGADEGRPVVLDDGARTSVLRRHRAD